MEAISVPNQGKELLNNLPHSTVKNVTETMLNQDTANLTSAEDPLDSRVPLDLQGTQALMVCPDPKVSLVWMVPQVILDPKVLLDLKDPLVNLDPRVIQASKVLLGPKVLLVQKAHVVKLVKKAIMVNLAPLVILVTQVRIYVLAIKACIELRYICALYPYG